MTSVSIAELKKIPYLDVDHLAGRTVASLSFYVNEQWHMWLPLNEGRLVKIKGWPSEGYYFGDKAEDPKDAFLGVLDFIAQRCSWPRVIRPFEGLMQDFFNMGASVRKIDLLVDRSKEHGTSASRLLITELEYLFSLCRSVFDLLQEIIAAQWDRVELFDTSIKKRSLPASFAKMCLDGDRLRTVTDIESQFRVPRPLAEFYVRRAAFFRMLRSFRDKYMHGGATIKLIFVTDKGFAVPRTLRPFSDFNVWNEEHMQPNELCSLRPAIGHLLIETLRACEDYASTCAEAIVHPPPVAPELRLLARGHFNQALKGYIDSIETCDWWHVAPEAAG